jgi:hypothetical protein
MLHRSLGSLPPSPVGSIRGEYDCPAHGYPSAMFSPLLPSLFPGVADLFFPKICLLVIVAKLQLKNNFVSFFKRTF